MTHAGALSRGRLGLVAASGLGLALSLGADNPVSGSAIFVRLAVAAGLVFFVPGVTVVLACRPLRLPSLLNTLAIGATISLVLLQAVTGVAVLGHIAFPLVVRGLAILATIALALVLFRRREVRQRLDSIDLAFLGGAAVVALALYPLTPLFARSEDQIHVAVIRRLVSLAEPRLDNIYMIPNLVFWYPIPGLQGAVAAVAILSGTDPIVAYAKLRGTWSFLTLLLTSRLAMLLFGGQKTLRLATGLVLVLFALNGTLSDVPLFYMGQMTSVSHPSDVGMNVYFPGLLMLTLLILRRAARDRLGFLSLTWLGLFATICVTHIREAAQLTVYLAAFLAGESARPTPARTVVRRTAWMTLGAVSILGAWGWMSRAIITGHVDAVTELRHRQILEVFHAMTWRDYVYPAFADTRFTNGQEVTFHAWLPVALVILPLIVVWRRRRREAAFAASGSLAFLLLVQIPILSVAYISATYYEILFSPIRNFVSFLYPTIGAGVVGLLVCLRTTRPLLRFAAVTTLGTALFFALPEVGLIHREAFHLLVLVVLVVALGMALRLRPARGTVEFPSNRMVSAVIATLAIVTWTPKTSPINRLISEERSFTFDDLLDLRPCPGGSGCNPSRAFMRRAGSILRTDDVVAISIHNPFSPTYYFRAQAPIWPEPQSYGTWTRPQFRTFFSFYDRALASGLPEPFFNAREDLVPRMEFLEALGATYVLVDPGSYGKVNRRLHVWPRHFEVVLDDGQWALYRFRPH